MKSNKLILKLSINKIFFRTVMLHKLKNIQEFNNIQRNYIIKVIY